MTTSDLQPRPEGTTIVQGTVAVEIGWRAIGTGRDAHVTITTLGPSRQDRDVAEHLLRWPEAPSWTQLVSSSSGQTAVTLTLAQAFDRLAAFQLSVEMKLTSSSFIDRVIAWWPRSPAPGPPPDPPDPEPHPHPDTPDAPDAPDEIIVNPDASHALFPMMWVSPPSREQREAARRHFVPPPPAQSSSWPLVQTLSAARATHDDAGRQAMLDAAASWIAGGDFFDDFATLPAPYATMPQLIGPLRAISGVLERAALQAQVEALLGCTIAQALDPTTLDPVLADLWQSLDALALTPTLTPSLRLLAHQITDALRVIAFLRWFEPLDLPRAPIEAPAPDASITPQPWGLATEVERREALDALVLAASEVTPWAGASPLTGDAGWVELLGVGQLWQVCERSARYTLGEIARSVNVMPGERRAQRERSRQTSRVAEASHTQRLSDARASRSQDQQLALRDELERQLRKRCQDDDFSNVQPQYGNLNLMFSGTATVQGCEADAREADLYSALQQVVERAASQLSEQVCEARAKTSLDEREEITATTWDNRAGHAARVGLYRWLRRVVHLGLRDGRQQLMVAWMLPTPAADYKQAQLSAMLAWGGPPTLVAPLQAPRAQGALLITADNYVSYGAQYGLDALPAPPVAQRVLSATLRRQPPEDRATLRVPPGYALTGSGSVVALLSDGSATLLGMAGGVSWAGASASPAPQALKAVAAGDAPACTCDPPAPPAPASQSFTIAGLDTSLEEVEVAAYCSASFTAQVSLPVASTLTPTADTPTAWQLATWDALREGYVAALGRYQAASHSRLYPQGGAPARRQVELAQLQRGAFAALAQLTGSTLDQLDPALLRFFQDAVRWDQSVYTYYAWGTGAPDAPVGWPDQARGPATEAQFEAFLNAQSAQLIAPLTPGREREFLFFLAYGMRWGADADSVPLPAPDSLALAALLGPPPAPPVRGWHVSLPTDLLYLQRDDALEPDPQGKRGGR